MLQSGWWLYGCTHLWKYMYTWNGWIYHRCKSYFNKIYWKKTIICQRSHGCFQYFFCYISLVHYMMIHSWIWMKVYMARVIKINSWIQQNIFPRRYIYINIFFKSPNQQCSNQEENTFTHFSTTFIWLLWLHMTFIWFLSVKTTALIG